MFYSARSIGTNDFRHPRNVIYCITRRSIITLGKQILHSSTTEIDAFLSRLIWVDFGSIVQAIYSWINFYFRHLLYKLLLMWRVAIHYHITHETISTLKKNQSFSIEMTDWLNHQWQSLKNSYNRQSSTIITKNWTNWQNPFIYFIIIMTS